MTDLCADHPFLRDLGTDLQDRLLECSAIQSFAPGDYLLRAGGPADRFHLVCVGRVALEVGHQAGRPLVIQTLDEGDVLGWSWMIPPYRSAFDARATTGVSTVSIDAQCLRQNMDQDPRFGYAVATRLIPALAQRLTSARLQMLDLFAPEPRRPRGPKV